MKAEVCLPTFKQVNPSTKQILTLSTVNEFVSAIFGGDIDNECLRLSR